MLAFSIWFYPWWHELNSNPKSVRTQVQVFTVEPPDFPGPRLCVLVSKDPCCPRQLVTVCEQECFCKIVWQNRSELTRISNRNHRRWIWTRVVSFRPLLVPLEALFPPSENSTLQSLDLFSYPAWSDPCEDELPVKLLPLVPWLCRPR